MARAELKAGRLVQSNGDRDDWTHTNTEYKHKSEWEHQAYIPRLISPTYRVYKDKSVVLRGSLAHAYMYLGYSRSVSVSVSRWPVLILPQRGMPFRNELATYGLCRTSHNIQLEPRHFLTDNVSCIGLKLLPASIHLGLCSWFMSMSSCPPGRNAPQILQHQQFVHC
jgi:hypothetical protein